ncbi:MAG: FGGY family carbohydrate kinase, partial [Planctomycetota bacterium]
SGTITTDPTHAASWGIYDIKNNDWDYELIDKLGISKDILPCVFPNKSFISELKVVIQEKLSLEGHVSVYSSIGDNQASIIGVTEGHNDTAIINIGTGGQVSIPSENFRYYDGLEVRPMPEGYIYAGSSLCGGWSYSYLCNFFKDCIAEFTDQNISEEEIFTKMNNLSENSEFESALSVDTRFLGTRISPDNRGSINNIDCSNLTAGNLVKGFQNGIIDELYSFAKIAGLDNITNIAASGNAVRKNENLKKIIEEKFNLPCSVSDQQEEAAYGAALVICEKE